ncbi:MAG TPA: hypothetical protein VM142_15365 [Acidimicrobiales bacterium]|nr:hypothetical protein [Acidimicrobiales bacterium]
MWRYSWFGLSLVSLLAGQGILAWGFVNHHANAEVVEDARAEGAAGMTGCGSSETTSAPEVVRSLAERTACSLFGPFPWQAGPVAARLLLLVELPLWYAAMALAAIGAWRLGPRAALGQWSVPLAFAAATVVVFSIYESNGGTALRQRGMLVPICACLAASWPGLGRISERGR